MTLGELIIQHGLTKDHRFRPFDTNRFGETIEYKCAICECSIVSLLEVPIIKDPSNKIITRNKFEDLSCRDFVIKDII